MAPSSRPINKKQFFQQTFEAYYAPFCLYARHFVADREVREDIVSDVFVRVWEKLDEDDFDPETAVGFIQRAVRNQCINYMKHREYETGYVDLLRRKMEMAADRPDHVYTLHALYEQLSALLKELPGNYREVFLKSFLEEKTQAEIAEELDLSVKTVNRYRQKMLSMLRERLKDYLPLLLLLGVVRLY